MRSFLSRLGPFLALLGVFSLFACLAPRSFSSLANLQTMARQTAIVGTAALGATLVIVVAGIDLSVGSVIALSTVVIASLLSAGVGPLPAALAGVLAGGLCGLMNGLLIVRMKVVPFIITLGTLLVVRGAAQGLAHEQTVDAPLTWLGDVLAALPPDRRWMLLPSGVWLLLLLALLTALALRYTAWGRHVFAVGSSEATARLCGVPVERVKAGVYALAGLFAGLAGVMQFSRLTVGDPTAAAGLELDVIAAVVIGGGSLSGGEGSVVGTLIGALVMTVIRSGCSQMGLPNWVQQIVTGSVIVVAVAMDRLRHRRDS